MIAKRVTVFGGATPKPGQPAYQNAMKLCGLLAKAGYVVLTGGYIGTMEAVSRGAAEAGGHVIGVTCDEIEAWRPVKANPWVMEEMRYPTLRQRMYALIDECDAAISLPGGIGSLAELAVTWSQLQTSASPIKPLILVGAGWQKTLDTFLDTLGEYVPEGSRSLLTYAEDIEMAFSILNGQII